MKKKFWDIHYKSFIENESSQFCEFCLSKFFNKNDIVIELGCGNGRDGIKIIESAYKYVGLDTCEVAVNYFNSRLKQKQIDGSVTIKCVDFTNIDFSQFIENGRRLIIYSRFSMHSINREEQSKLISNLKKIKTDNWLLLLESRTIYDSLYGKGNNVGENAFETDHYRRFLDPNDFVSLISKKFFLKYYEISSGFAPYENEDPIVMRIVFGVDPFK